MADLLETGLSAGGGSIIGAVVAYFGLEKRVGALEKEAKEHVTKADCQKCSDHNSEWREEIRNKLDMLIDLHLTNKTP